MKDLVSNQDERQQYEIDIANTNEEYKLKNHIFKSLEIINEESNVDDSLNDFPERKRNSKI
jgi:hypothetical protein